MAFSRIVLFTVLVTLAKAGPLNPKAETKRTTCAVQCSDNKKFDYQPGTVYEFSYDAKTTTKMNGASEDSATINMNTKVEIEPITKCDLVMKIKDASLRDSEDDQNSQVFKEAMMKQPLKFSFQDGRIDHICAMDGESTWTLNIKRGILSAFQNSMDSFDRDQNLTETDVVGSCGSEYKILDEGRRTMLVEKTKNLLGCSDREGYRLAVQSIGYNVPSFVKSLPLMKSEYKCTQTLDLGSNILQSSTCSEEHVFRPFSYGKNGAMTSSEQTLTFTNKRRSRHLSDEHFSQRSTLLFHHQHDTPSKQEKEEKIEAKLQELCQKAAEDIRPEVPEMVNQLIEHMRQVDRDVLSRVYRKINQRTICARKADRIKQYFHDAIPMVGTAASVGMIQDLISKKDVTGSEAEMWLLSLSFVHHPTKEMVAAAMPLLDERDVSGNTLLAVSSLASSYCNVRPDCGKDSEISALTRKLMDLTHDCNSQNGDARRIVFAFRALGNIGHSHEAVSHLTRCFTRRDVREEIRIAAMDAFRRIPCDAMRSDLMGVFRDASEDSELRLNAYIALMKCPSRKVMSEVRQVLEKEKSNQVGSFVWSHLTNLMETSDPHMQDIRNIVQDEELKKEFNLDQRKFSRNYEGSFFLDSINTGAKVDSNVIFSQKSFIPRSANLNLTIDLFGHAINFLEFGGRVQGLESILENFFRPIAGKEPKTKTKLPLNFDKSMDAFRASAYLRVFGNELRYWDDKSLNELQSSLQRLMHMQALSFSKTMVLLDSRMIIPTCVGLPLNLSMSATGSISLDAKASFQRPKFELNVDFKPSASVQVKGEMSVDAHVSRAGLKMVTVAHTSTGARLDIRNNKFDLQIPQKKMEIFNLKTDFYIVHRNTEKEQRMIVDNVKKHETCTGKLMKQVTGLTFCQIIKFPNASPHNETTLFPFTGPVVYDLYMINEDAPNGYQIEAFSKKWPSSVSIDTPASKTQRRISLKTAVKNKNEVEISFSAPWKNIQFEGAFINRRDMKKLSGKLSTRGRSNFAFSAQLGVKSTKDSLIYTPLLEITIPQKKLKYKGIIEIHPMKSFLMDMDAEGFTDDNINLKVSGENLPQNIGLSTQLRIGKKEYYIASRLGRLVSKSGFKYTPSLKITIPSKDLVELTSEINYITAKRASLQFTLKKVFSKMVDLNVALVHHAGSMKSKISLLLAFKSPKGSCQIIGHTDIKKALWISSVTATYHFGDKYSDSLILSSKFKDLSTMKTTRLITNINLQSEKHSSLRFHVNGELSKNDNLLETNVEVQHGNPENKAVNSFKFFSVATKDLKPFSHSYNYAMSIQYPGQKINYTVEANHVQSAKWPFRKFENKVMVQMAPGKVVQTRLFYNNAKVKGLPTYESEIALSYPGRDMKIADKLTQVNKNTYENHFTVQWQKGREAAVQSTYTKTGKNIHNIENTFRLPNKKEAKATAMLQATPGAYKAKVQFAVDEEMISRQRINYMAGGGVTYTFNAKQMSSDVNAEVMWAPNQKISANINFDYMKRGLFSSKLAFSTPFDAMKNFDSQAKYIWASRKYTSMMSVSWNNQNELKQDFSFVYTDFHLSYDASALLNGKKSEIGLAMKYSDMSLNANIKVSHDKTTIIDVILKHNAQKISSEGEIGLDFDILDSNGKMKITLKYDKRKGEVMSNGEGTLNLPLQQLRHIGASYNLKHNNDLSSIDMSYSSSLRNYRNGKMSIEMKRNLPKMLTATMDLTLNGNPMFNMNANYERQRDNIDMKVDITEPSGEKITVSGSVNFSGSRKTANVGIKSRFIEFSADGAFEYQGTRSAGGELKVTADSKNIMISGNYKKDAAVNVNGILVLPDGRKIDGKFIFNDKDKIDTSFVLNSPGFQRLKHIDIRFTKLFDSVSTLTKGHIKILPHLEKNEFEASLSTRDDTTFALELKTPWIKVNQVKATMSLRQDSTTSRMMESEFLLNKNKIIEMKFRSDIKNLKDISTSFELKTSHQRFDSVIVNFRHTGILSDMKSNVNVTVGQETKFNVRLRNSGLHSEISLKTHVMNFDDWEILFIRQGNLNNLQTTLIHKYGGKEGAKCGFFINGYHPSINITVKYPGIVNFDLYMDLNMEDMTLSLISSLAAKRQVYKFFVAYQHLTHLSMTATVPSCYHELLMTFVEKSFRVRANVIHNNRNYTASLSIDDDYGKIEAHFNTPYSQDSVFFTKNGKVKKMTVDVRGVHNGQTFKLTFSNVDYYRQLKSVLSTSSLNLSIDFFLNGIDRKFNTALTIQHNNKQYEMKASNTEYTRSMNFMLNTPAGKCVFQFMKEAHKVIGTFSALFGGEKYELKLKKEPGFEISLLLSKYFEIRIVHMGNSYSSVLKAHLKVMSYLDECKLEARLVNQGLKLDLVLKTPLDGLKNVHATVSLQRNSIFAQKLTLECSLNDQKPIKIKCIYRINSTQDFTASLEVKTPHHRFEEINVDVKYFRQKFQMDSSLKAKFGREINVEAEIRNTDKMSEISLKAELEDYDAGEILITRLGFRDNMTVTFSQKIGREELFSGKLFIEIHDTSFNIKIKSSIFNFEFESELNPENISFNLRSSLELQQKEIYKIVATYEHVTKLHVRTSVSSYNCELTMTLDENVKICNASLKLKLANLLMLDAMFQNSRSASKVSLDAQLLDFDEWKSTFELKGNPDDMTASIITSIAKKEVNRIDASLKEYGRSINVKVNGPKPVNFDFNMDLDTETITFNMASTFTLNGLEKYEMSTSYEHLSKLQIKTSIPSYQDELLIMFSGNLKAFNVQTKFSHNNLIYELMLSNKEYYRQVKGILNTPYFQDKASFKFDGELNEMNIFAQVMHNKDKFQLTFSNSGYYQQIDAKLDTPYFQPTLKFSLIGNPKKFNFLLRIHFDKQTYTMKASNEEYFRQMNFLLKTPKLNCNFRFSKTEGYFYLSYAKAKCELKIKTQDNVEFFFHLINPGFNPHSNLELQREEIYKIVATYEHLAKLYIKTSFPSYNDELTMTLNGDLKMFNALAKLTHNTSKYELIISNQGYYRKIDAQLVTPFFTDMASFIFNGDEETFNAQAKFMHDNDSFRNMNVKLTNPSFKMDLLFKFDGNLKTFYSTTEFTCCEKLYKLTIGSINYYRSMNAELNTPSIQTNALFKFDGDLEAFNSTARFTHNDKQYELTLANADYYQEINATLSTPFSQQSAMFNMKGHWKNYTLEASVTHKQNTYYLGVYNRRFYQALSARLFTPFFQTNGSFTSGENLGSFKLMSHLSYDDKQYQLSVNSLHNYRNMEVKAKTPSFKTEALFNLKEDNKLVLAVAKFSYNDKQYRLSVGNADYNSKSIAELIPTSFETDAAFTFDGNQETFTFMSQVIYNKKRYHLNCSSTDYYRNIKAKMITPSSKTDVSLGFNGNLNTFNVMAQITFNGQHYGLNIANSDFYRKIWTKVTTPQFTDSFLFNLKGNLEAFMAQTTFAHNNTQYKLSVSNKDYYKQILIGFSTPYFNKSLLVHLNGDLKAFNIKATFKHNNEQYELMVSNGGYYRRISIKLTTPFSEDSASFSFNGSWEHFSSKIKVMYQKEQYELVINGHYLEMWAALKTPSIRVTAIFSLKGKSHAFNISMSLSHNNSDYQMSVSVVRYYQRINVEVVTPLISSEVIFNFEQESKELKARASLIYASQLHEVVILNSGYYRTIDIKLTTPFINASVSYNLKGNLKSFTLQTTLTHNHDQYKVSVSNKDYFRQMSGNLSTPYLRDTFSFNLNGDLKTFDVKATFKHNTDQYELTVSNKGYYQQMTTHLKTPFSEDSFSFLFDGSLTNFTFKVHALYNKNQYELAVSSRGYYREFEAKLTSPFFNCSAMFSLNGHLESFQVLAKAAYNTDKYQMKISNKGYFESTSAELIIPHLNTSKMSKYQLTFFSNGFHRQMNLKMLTPLSEESIDSTYTGNLEKFNAVLTVKHNDTVYDMKISNRDIYHQMNFHLNTPFVVCDFRFDWSKETVNGIFEINIGKERYELLVSGNTYSKVSEFKLSNTRHRLHIKSNIYYKKNSVTGDVTALLNRKKIVVTGIYKDTGRKKIIKADLTTPYFEDSLQGSIAGTLRKFNANIKLQHNKNVYEMMASNKNYYNELDLSLKAPGVRAKFQSEGNLQKCQVSASLKMATDLYELTLSNQNYLRNINLEVFTPRTGKCTFNFAFQGNWDHFDVESQFSQRNYKYELNISSDSKTGEYGLKCFTPQINVNGRFNGDLKSFSFNADAVFKKEKYEVMASTKNYFREISANLTTPQLGKQSFSVKINGQLKDFSGFIEVKNNNELYRSEFSLTNHEFKGSLCLPRLQEELQVKFLSCRDNIELFIQFLHNGQRYEMNITKTKILKSHIIISHWGAINATVNGDLRNGKTKIKVFFGKNVFENAAQIRFDGNRLDIDVKILYKLLGRSGQFDIQISNITNKKLFKSELQVNAGDVEFTAIVSLKFSPHMNAVLTVNLTNIDNSEMKLRVVSEGFHKIDAILDLKTPWTKVSKVFYVHNINPEKGLSSKAYIERNEIRLVGYSVHATFNSSYNFGFKCDYNNYINKLLVKGDLKFHGPVTVAIFRVNTSFGTLKELDISTKMSQESLSGVLNLKQQKHQIGLKFDLNKNSGRTSLSANVNTLKNRRYQLQIFYKNADQRADVSRTFNFKMVHPVRTVGGKYHFENTQHSMVMSGDLMWDEARGKKAGFELMVQKGDQKQGKLRIITPRRTVELFGRVEVNGNHYSTVGHIMMDENNKAQKVDIKADMMKSSDRADIDLTVKFPNQKKGMNLKTSVNVPKDDIIFSSTSEFSLDQDPQKTFKMSTKLMSETKGQHEMYTVQVNAGHAHSGFATEVVGRVSSSPEKYKADVEMGYLTFKRQQQRLAIRADMNTLNREVNLKLEAPSKTIELDGSVRTGNRYMMSVLKKESGKENMEALFKLNPTSQRMNIIFNYDEENPNKVYRIDAEIMESKTLIKAYRAGKQSNLIEDAAIYAELKPHNILKSSIRWNPHLFQEFNVFENQKLKMYGEQLKDFGESFGKIFNDEVFAKLVLVKKSFGEDLSSFNDIFLAEFGALSQDFDKVWQEFKEMYQRNYFYLKSGTRTIYRAWGDLWSNNQRKMGQIRMRVESIYKKMSTKVEEVIRIFDHKYAQYEVLFTKKSSEIFAYSRTQCEKLYQSAMKIQAEINRTIETYQPIIKEVIDRMRQNPYGEKVIDFLMTMYEAVNEKTVQVKEHMQPLTSAIYSAHATLNRHIARVRRYPIVDVIMDATNEVYQQALWAYDYWDVKDNVLGLKDTLYKLGAEKIKEIKDIVTDVGMNTLIVDPKRGEIIVEIRFGAAKYAYNHFMSSVEDVKRAVMKLSNLMANTDLNVWDIYYMMKPSSDLYDYIPPFKAEATLFAGQHITTFDGRHLNYKATCSYLLARDFVDGNFSVVANFDADRRAKSLKSLSLTTAHNEQVEIFPDNKVFFNRRVVELPLQLTDATVTRQGNLIVVQSKRGYKVMCDHDIQLYTVQISGWYFNKMAGLFGNYNNEPIDDMLMSNSRYTNDLEQFAQSWSVSRQCTSHRNFAPSHMVPENRECAQLFLQIDSPFRYCFTQIKPDYFYKTCATQLSSDWATSHDLCKVTSFYIKGCEKRRVFLQQPALCKTVPDKVENHSLSM